MEKTFNVHPGEILKEYLDEMEISAYRLARATGISESNLRELINGKKNITARLSLLLGKFFGFNEEYWLRMQNHYDILEEKKKIKTKLKSVQIWGKSKVAV
jgi:addiction module HigA family antidote